MRQLSKATSAAKIEQPLPVSPATKFRRTSKLPSAQDTNASSEKTDSAISQDTRTDKPQMLVRTSQRDKREASRSASTIQNPFLSNPGTSKLKTQPQEGIPQSNFTKKTPSNICTEPSLSPEYELKSMRPNLSPRATISKQAELPMEVSSKGKEEQKRVLKRAPVFLILVQRLLKQKMAGSLKALWDYKRSVKIKHQRQAHILAHSSSQLASTIKFRMKSHAMSMLKAIISKLSWENSAIEEALTKLAQTNLRNYLPHHLHLLFCTKLRSAFRVVSINRGKRQWLIRCYPTLFNLERRKIRGALELIKRLPNQLKQRKTVLLRNVESSFKSFGRVILANSFRKILLFTTNNKRNKSRQNTTQACLKIHHDVLLVKQAQFQAKRQLKVKQKHRVEKELKSITQKIAATKRQHQIELQQLQLHLQNLQKTGHQIRKEIDRSNTISQALKEQIQLRPQSSQLYVQEQNGGEKLIILQQIYCSIWKMTQQELTDSLPRIQKECELGESCISPLVLQWLEVKRRQALQQQINRYEEQLLGSERKEGGGAGMGRMIRQQNQMLAQIIRSHMKERYLWSEVSQLVASVL